MVNDLKADKLTALGARLFQVPISIVFSHKIGTSLVSSCLGLPQDRAECFCRFLRAQSADLFLVENAEEESELYQRYGLRFCAALSMANGMVCLADRVARKFTECDLASLHDFRAVAADLLDHRKVEADQSGLFKLIVDNMPGLVGYWNKDLYCLFGNKAYTDWYGNVTGMVGKHFSEVVPEAVYEARLPYIQGVLEGKPQVYETPYFKEGGTQIELLVQYFPHLEAGEVLGFFVHFSDITEQKQTKKTLLECETNLRSAFENAAIGITMVGLDRVIMRANQAYCGMLGYSLSEIEGMSVQEFTHPDDIEKDLEYIGRLLQGMTSFNRDKRYIHKKGHILWVSLHVTLVRDSSGTPLHFVGHTLEITERKQLEEGLTHSQKMEVIGRLAGGVAHDFNNILTAMMMNLAEYYSINPHLEEDSPLKEVESLSREGAKLTRQLLEFSRQRTMKRVKVELNSHLSHLLLILRRLIGESIQINLITAVPCLWVEVDTGLIDQVIMNLCVNARDAMPEGGHLTLNTDLRELKPGRLLGEARPGSFVCLSVRDTGKGMDERILAHIFEPFFTTKEVGKGTGLGLASSYGIVHQHEGWIEVSSQLGLGSEFRIYLPAQSEDAPIGPLRTLPSGPPLAKKTILLVEDHEPVRRATKRILENNGFRVMTAEDAPNALRIWDEKGADVDLLITDMIMPNGMNGLQLREHLLEKRPGLLSILVSGFSEEVLKQDAARKMIFLPKPYEIHELINLINHVLSHGA